MYKYWLWEVPYFKPILWHIQYVVYTSNLYSNCSGDMSGVKSIESCDHHVEQVMNSHDVDMKSADPQSTTVPPGKEPTIDMFAEQVSELDPAA